MSRPPRSAAARAVRSFVPASPTRLLTRDDIIANRDRVRAGKEEPAADPEAANQAEGNPQEWPLVPKTAAAFASQQRTKSVHGGYAPVELIDAMLFFQGILKPHFDPKKRTSRFSRPRLVLGTWKQIVAEMLRLMKQYEVDEEKYFTDLRCTQTPTFAAKSKLEWKKYLVDLAAMRQRLVDRSAALKDQVLQFRLRSKATQRKQNSLSHRANVNGVSDDELLVHGFRLLRGDQYEYPPTDEFDIPNSLRYELEEDDFIVPDEPEGHNSFQGNGEEEDDSDSSDDSCSSKEDSSSSSSSSSSSDFDSDDDEPLIPPSRKRKHGDLTTGEVNKSASAQAPSRQSDKAALSPPAKKRALLSTSSPSKPIANTAAKVAA